MKNYNVFINENNYKDILQVEIIDNKQLINMFGSETNKKTYEKVKKVNNTMLSTLLKRANVYCEIQKIDKGKYKIIQIYEQIKKINKISKRKRKSEQINYPKEFDKMNGVYSITFENKMYIGSTVAGFRNRHMAYLSSNQKYNKGQFLFDNGGKINILWSTESKDEYEIRLKEIEYIDYYNEYTNREVVNSADRVLVLKDKKRKIIKNKNKKKRKIYKSIKISSEDYDKVLKILTDNNIEIK